MYPGESRGQENVASPKWPSLVGAFLKYRLFFIFSKLNDFYVSSHNNFYSVAHSGGHDDDDAYSSTGG